MKQDVILNGHQVTFLICFILAIQIQAEELPNLSNLTDLLKLLPGNQTFLSETTIQEQCPQLYANTQEQKSDVLELPKSCPTDITSYLLCFVTIQSSNQLCNMSHTIKLRDHQLPETTYTNATSESICKSFEDPTMVSNLTLYINKYLQTKIPASYIFSQGCNQLCKGNNTNLCAIILFNFKTMMQWNQDYNQEQQSLLIPTENPTQHATKIATIPSQLLTTGNISNLSNSTKSMTTTSVKTIPTASTKTDVTITVAHVTQKAKGKHTGATKQPKAKTEHSKKIMTHPPIEKTYEGEQEVPQENVEDSAIENKYPADDNNVLLGSESNEEKTTRGSIQVGSHSHDSDRYFEQPEDTHFLFYFISFAALSACGYVIYIKRKRIIALIIEGRGQPSSSRRRSSSSRERSGGYRKLVNNLEEVITSSQAVKHTNVIY